MNTRKVTLLLAKIQAIYPFRETCTYIYNYVTNYVTEIDETDGLKCFRKIKNFISPS